MARLNSKSASVLAIANTGAATFHADVPVALPGEKRILAIPNVSVPAGQSLWLPVAVSLGSKGLCRECANFSPAENMVYATAELLSIEYENGILALEFAAPEKGEAVLQLAREPAGPYLAAGAPKDFDWDPQTLRARLPIPASVAPGNRVRVGLAMEAPDSTAFFSEARRLLVGRENTIATNYSSPQLAKRSRLRVPAGYTARPMEKSPTEIDYVVMAPPGAVPGDWADFTLEADGAPLGRARLDLVPPLTVRLTRPVDLRLGPNLRVSPQSPVAVFDPKLGSEVEIAVRNHSESIQNYRLEPTGEGLEFMPARADLTVGALAERTITFRVFGAGDGAALRPWRLKVSGDAAADVDLRALAAPRDRTVAWSADLDECGTAEWILESAKIRAVFTPRDGGRWLEFTAKDFGVNFLSERGAFGAREETAVSASGDTLEFTAASWKRTVRLAGETLTIEESAPLPGDALISEKRGGATLTVERPSTQKTIYSVK